jgi:hypothetical protein
LPNKFAAGLKDDLANPLALKLPFYQTGSGTAAVEGSDVYLNGNRIHSHRAIREYQPENHGKDRRIVINCPSSCVGAANERSCQY